MTQKTWKLNKSCLYDPHHVPDDIIYAKTSGEAKSKFLSEKDADSYGDSDTGAPLTFLTIRVQRCPEQDRYMFDDKWKTPVELAYEKAVKDRNDQLDELVRMHPEGKAYIMKGYYYYRENSCGYTEKVVQAGIYSVQEAADTIRRCSLRDNMRIIVIDVETHNRLLNEEIEGLKKRLINIL